MNKFLLLTFLLMISSLSNAATPFGRIVDIKGSAFISHDGKTKEVKKGDQILANSEIVIEHAGQVVFTDNADHRFHLGNSSSVAVFVKHIELRSGDVWFQSLNKVDEYKITTANAIVNYQGGEAIVSYDSEKGKTQLMVINGLMKFSNLMSPALNLTVGEGRFSFVDNAYEEGMPRDPTPAGEKTYGKLVAMFPGVTPLDKNSIEVFRGNDHAVTNEAAHSENDHPQRAIASMQADGELEKYKESLLDVHHNNKKNGLKKTHKSKKIPVNAVEEKLVIQIYGQKQTNELTSEPRKTRAPASVDLVIDEKIPSSQELNNNPEQNKLQKQRKEQYKESEKLIDQLNQL